MINSSASRLSLTAIALLTIVPALLYGRFTNRWHTPESPNVAERMDDFPTSFGSWKTVGDNEPLSDRVIRELGIRSYINRQYRHVDSDARVDLILMGGTPGPLVRHPPDICYGVRANTLLNETQTDIAGQAAGSEEAGSQFRVLTYKPNSQIRQPFNVAYAFSVGEQWAVPSWPRITYGAFPYLYKAQIRSSLVQDDLAQKGTAVEMFLEDFVAAFAEFQRL
jgi:hypothetical protein